LPLAHHKSLALLLVDAELLDGSGLGGLLVWGPTKLTERSEGPD
jgi:hypothetical protein